MRSLSRASVRTRIAALLAVLVALWGFAAWVTTRESLDLLYLGYLESASQATGGLVEAVQQERRISLVVLGGGGEDGEDGGETGPARAELAEARATTDRQAAAWRELVGRRSQRLSASDRLIVRYDQLSVQLRTLTGLRAEVDAGTLDRLTALDAYSTVVDAGFDVYRAMSNLDDREVARQSGLIVDLSQAREQLARQDSLLAGAQAAGALPEPELVAFTQLVGGQRLLHDRTVVELPADDRARYDQAVETAVVVELQRMQDRVMAEARPGAAPPVTAAEWDPVATGAIDTLRELEVAAADHLVQQATPVVAGIIARLVLAGVLGLIAVILSLTTGRTLIRQLEQVRDAARDLATTRLPRVVRRLSTGEEVDVTAEAPPMPAPGGHEVGQLAAAFNTVQQAAVEAAVGQAELRRGVRDVFLSLARRTQGLVRRQLRELDQAEQGEVDPDKLAALFRIDHLATRMRRNAENLIVLSGANTGRNWRRPVAIVDVVRGAISEVEDYARVKVLAVDPGAMAGQVVGDAIHLLAELIENAVSFSPPYAQVTVAGHRVARGFAIEVEDRGLGMSEADLAAVNRKLADPPDFDLADASHLGHYVVAKLAERHEIGVQLKRSPFGGVTAVVLIPAPLVEADVEDAPALAATIPAAALPAAALPAVVTPAVATPDEGQPGGLTPAGLPWRVRQSTLPGQLAGEPARPALESADAAGAAPVRHPDADEAGAAPVRDPEAVRRMMSALQRGTAAGRVSVDADPAEPAHPADPVASHTDRPPDDRQEG